MRPSRDRAIPVNPLDPLLRACLTNPALKARLIAEPKKVLAEHGLKVPPGVTIKVVENTPQIFHVVLPVSTSSDLDDSELESAAGGWHVGGSASGRVHPPTCG